MASAKPRKNVSYTFVFAMINKLDPSAFYSAESITKASYYKDGTGAWTAFTIAGAVSEIGTTGIYQLTLTAAEMNHDHLAIKFTGPNSQATYIHESLNENDDDTLKTLIGTPGLTSTVCGDITNVRGTVDSTYTKVNSTGVIVTGTPAVNVTQISGSIAAADRLETTALSIIAGAAVGGVGGVLTTTAMTTNLTQSVNEFYNGRQIIWTTGDLTGQAATLVGYDGATKKLEFYAVTMAPAAGDNFIIV